MKPYLAKTKDIGTRDFGKGLKLKILIDCEDGAKHATFGTVAIEPEMATPMHVREVEEYIFMISGEGQVITEDGETYTLEQGDCILIPPGINHCHANKSKFPLLQLYAFAPMGPEKTLRNLPLEKKEL